MVLRCHVGACRCFVFALTAIVLLLFCVVSSPWVTSGSSIRRGHSSDAVLFRRPSDSHFLSTTNRTVRAVACSPDPEDPEAPDRCMIAVDEKVENKIVRTLREDDSNDTRLHGAVLLNGEGKPVHGVLFNADRLFFVSTFLTSALSNTSNAEKRVLLLGLGDGMLAHAIAALPGRPRVEVLEPDPAVLSLAQEWFDFRASDRVRVHQLPDMDLALRKFESGPRFHVILVRLCVRGRGVLVQCPRPDLLTPNIAERLLRLLRPSGMIAMHIDSVPDSAEVRADPVIKLLELEPEAATFELFDWGSGSCFTMTSKPRRVLVCSQRFLGSRTHIVQQLQKKNVVPPFAKSHLLRPLAIE